MSMLCCGLPLHEAGIHCAVLEVKASSGSDLRTVSHAYQLLVDRHHPDQAGRTAAMGEIERANEELVKKENFSKYKADLAGLYQADLRALPETLKNEAMEALHDGDFERVKGFLEVVPELSLLPCGEDVSIRTTIHERIRSKFSHCLTSAEDSWEKQDLRRLDMQLKMIKSMSDSLSGCEDLLPSGWREDFESKLRTKVNQHDRAARDFLKGSTDEWDSNIKEFGRELVLLARIYEYLPEFARVASSVRAKIDLLLDRCQGSSEGVLFLFKLGMLLEQGQCGDIIDGAVNIEDQRIAKQIVMDYRQFSEVRTVVWNQQTAGMAQKDVSEIISEFKVQPDEAFVVPLFTLFLAIWGVATISTKKHTKLTWMHGKKQAWTTKRFFPHLQRKRSSLQLVWHLLLRSTGTSNARTSCPRSWLRRCPQFQLMSFWRSKGL